MNLKYKQIIFLLTFIFIIIITGYIIHIKIGIKYTIEGIIYGLIFGFYVSIVESLLNLLILRRKLEIKYNFKEISILSALIVAGITCIRFANPTIFSSENILGFMSATAISYLPIKIITIYKINNYIR